MTLRETAIQAVRALVKTAGTLTDAQVLRGPVVGARPAAAYLAVSAGSVVTTGEPGVYDVIESGASKARVRQWREVVVTVNAYGDDAVGWLEDLALALVLPSTLEAAAALGVSVVPVADVVDLTAVQDTAFVRRAAQDYRVRVLHAPTAAVEATVGVATVVLDLEAAAGDEDPLSQTITLE